MSPGRGLGAVILGAMLALSAPAGAAPAPALRDAQSGDTFTEQDDGRIVHNASGFVFPLKVALRLRRGA